MGIVSIIGLLMFATTAYLADFFMEKDPERSIFYKYSSLVILILSLSSGAVTTYGTFFTN